MKKMLLLFILLIGAAAYILFFRKDLILSKAEAKHLGAHPSSKFIIWKGNEVHFTDEGKGNPVIMLHPFGGSHNNFRSLSEALKDSFRVIRVDLPGSGLSDFHHSGQMGIQYFEEYENFLKTVADSLHLSSFYLIGNSFGGAVAYTFAAHHPLRVIKLMLLCSIGYDSENVMKEGAGVLRYNATELCFKRGVPKKMVKAMHLYHLADRSKAESGDISYHNIAVNRQGNIPTWFDFVASRQYPDSTLIGKIKCSTLIIWGKEDRLTPVGHAQRFKRDIPGSKVIIYSPAGHMPQMEFPESIAAAFTAFVREK